MVGINAINQDPTSYFNQKDLTNPWAVPVVTQALYDQGKISKLDPAALSMNPMMAPVIAPAIQMAPPLKSDTVDFKSNGENSKESPKSNINKGLAIGGILLAVGGLAAFFLTRGKNSKGTVKAGQEIIEQSTSGKGNDIAKVYTEAFEEAPRLDGKGVRLTAKNDFANTKISMQSKIAEIKEKSKNPAQELYDLSKTLEKQVTPESYIQTIVVEEELLNNYASSLAKSNDKLLKRLASNVANHYIFIGDLNEANKIAVKFGLA